MATFASFRTYSTELDPLCTFLVGFSENTNRTSNSDPLLKEIKINIEDLVPANFVGFEYTPTVASSAFIVGYAENDDRVNESDPVTKKIKMTIEDLGHAIGMPFRFTKHESLTGNYDEVLNPMDYRNIGFYDNTIYNEGYGNILLSLYASNYITDGYDNVLLQSNDTNFNSASSCISIGNSFENFSGIKNLSIGGNNNDIFGNQNSNIGTSNEYNTISGIGNAVINSSGNVLSSRSDSSVVIGGGLNSLNGITDLTGLFNTVGNILNNTNQCSIIGGDSNTFVGNVSGVTLLGIENRTITSASNFYTITPNLSVLGDLASNRVLLASPNGTRYFISVTNTGILCATPA